MWYENGMLEKVREELEGFTSSSAKLEDGREIKFDTLTPGGIGIEAWYTSRAYAEDAFHTALRIYLETRTGDILWRQKPELSKLACLSAEGPRTFFTLEARVAVVPSSLLSKVR